MSSFLISFGCYVPYNVKIGLFFIDFYADIINKMSAIVEVNEEKLEVGFPGYIIQRRVLILNFQKFLWVAFFSLKIREKEP